MWFPTRFGQKEATMEKFSEDLLVFTTCEFEKGAGHEEKDCIHPTDGENAPSLLQLTFSYLCTSSLPLLFGVLFSLLFASVGRWISLHQWVGICFRFVLGIRFSFVL